MTNLALLEQIADQAKTVRRLQRQFFARHDRQTLEDSKAAERELDRLLARRDGIPEQAALFDEPVACDRQNGTRQRVHRAGEGPMP